jgi:cytochrome P450
LSPWAINRSKKHWGPTAEEFLPERWISADGTTNKTGGATSNYSQITFLHGPRSCIGQDFAASELKCLCATLVGKFQFELARSEEGGQYTPAGVVTTKAQKVSRMFFFFTSTLIQRLLTMTLLGNVAQNEGSSWMVGLFR